MMKNRIIYNGFSVIPAKAEIQKANGIKVSWIPAFAGMTIIKIIGYGESHQRA